jgi:hypothetical protein
MPVWMGGGGLKYVKLLYILATAGGRGEGGESEYVKLLYILAEHRIQNTECRNSCT